MMYNRLIVDGKVLIIKIHNKKKVLFTKERGKVAKGIRGMIKEPDEDASMPLLIGQS